MTPPPAPSDAVAIELNAVLVALTANQPLVLTLEDGTLLPSGPFATEHPTLQSGLRAWVERQTNHPLGYVEQLYTFADRNRPGSDGCQRVVSISYLGLTRERLSAGARDPEWRSWYRYFPWEDWRRGRPALLDQTIAPALAAWAALARGEEMKARLARARLLFALDGAPWLEERVLERYELLYEASLAPEAERDRIRAAGLPSTEPAAGAALLGEPMISDHRRILATGLGRLRGKLKYRPVAFELTAPEFTLSTLQRTVEAIIGAPLHKQNFRRALERAGLVEGLGRMDAGTGGRPAELFRFRREAMASGAAQGMSLPLLRD